MYRCWVVITRPIRNAVAGHAVRRGHGYRVHHVVSHKGLYGSVIVCATVAGGAVAMRPNSSGNAPYKTAENFGSPNLEDFAYGTNGFGNFNGNTVCCELTAPVVPETPVTPVPEPGTVAILALALLATLFIRKLN